MTKQYKVFRRTWWRENPSWPNGLEPCPGKRRYVRGAAFNNEVDARAYCQRRNTEPRTARQERLSLKFEYTRE